MNVDLRSIRLHTRMYTMYGMKARHRVGQAYSRKVSLLRTFTGDTSEYKHYR